MRKLGTPLNGYIKLYRQMLDWGWYDDTNTKVVFIHLLLIANFTDREWHGITIPRGSVATSIRKISTELKLSEQSVRTALEHLKSTGEITSKGYSKFTMISIKNYDLYQSGNEQTNDEITKNQRAINDEVTNSQRQRKNDKKERIKEGKNDNSLSSAKAEEAASFDFNSIVELFHSLCPSLERVKKLTKKQKSDIIKANTVLNGDFTSLFNRVEKSDFLRGAKGNWNGASLGWIVDPDHLEIILSGRYDNKAIINTDSKPNYDEEF